jgi:hypothetical protein
MPEEKQLSYDLVVASDNNNYLAWQCMVAHHSCITHLGKVPIFTVHGGNEPLVEGYRILKEKGGIIQRLPSERLAGKFDYVCRNVWATLKGVETSADYIVLCDPDIVFLRPVDFSGIAAGLHEESVSLDRVGYMRVGDHNRAILEEVCKASWIDKRLLDGITSSGGMPYVIPTIFRRRIAREWAARTEDCLVASLKHHGKMNSEVWISIMWGFVLAALRNDIPMSFTNLCIANGASSENQAAALSQHAIIHYCYGDEFFNKKNYMNKDASVSAVWKASAPEGTVNGAVSKAIRDAAIFYGLA